jgi:hypothetical protein
MSPYARAAADVGLLIDLNAAHAEAATFLDPILAGTGTGYWDSTQKCWIVPEQRPQAPPAGFSARLQQHENLVVPMSSAPRNCGF